jgi:hypothetical protein
MTDLTGKTLSHYRVEAKIGEGGMGEVYDLPDGKAQEALVRTHDADGGVVSGEASLRGRLPIARQVAGLTLLRQQLPSAK